MPKLRALPDVILCTDGDFGPEKTSSGILIGKTIGTADGITPRWFKVFDVGSNIKGITKGEWICVEYGRWTEGVNADDPELVDEENMPKKVWRIDPKGVMLSADEKPNTLNINADVASTQKKRLPV